VEELVAAPDSVWRTGRIPYEKVNRYLAACDVCWLPMRDSGANRGRYPLKLNDYMAAGRPTVATSVGDVATLFTEEAIGLLAADKPEPFAVQTLRLLQDHDLRLALGQRARQVAETRFSWTRLTDELEMFYKQVVAHK
jgi:glycosyltransferase involved in cell wall biosynthesis